MSLNSLQIENFSISYDYFNCLKNSSNNILTFIKQYKTVSIDYKKKLEEIYKNFKVESDKTIKDINDKKIKDFSKILFFINSIPKIINVYIENLNFFIEQLEKGLMKYENLNVDLIVPTCQKQFNQLKEHLLEKGKEISDAKQIFNDDMNNTEEIIYLYYYTNNTNNKKNEDNKDNKDNKNTKNNKDNEKIKDNKLDKNQVITEEIMNNCINKSKEVEQLYKKQIEEGRREEDNFVKYSKFYCESIKKITSSIFQQLKHLILDFLFSFKNNLKIPQTEIDSSLRDLVKLDNSLKIEKIMEKNYHNDTKYKYLYDAEKYDLQMLKINNNINNINNNNINNNPKKNEERKVIEIEDGYQKTIYINDENTLLAIEKMKNNFELINLDKVDINIEKEKRKTNELTLQLLSNLTKEKQDNKELINITEKEIIFTSIKQI